MSILIVSKDRGESQDSVKAYLFICQKNLKLCKKNRNFFEKPLDIPKDPGYNIARVKKELKGKRKAHKKAGTKVSWLCLLFSQKAETESGRKIRQGSWSCKGRVKQSSEKTKQKGVGPMAQLNVEQQHMAADRAAN